MSEFDKTNQEKMGFKERFRSFIYDSTVDIQDRAFIMFSFTVLVALFVAIPSGLIMREPLIATASTIVGALFFLAYVYYSVKRNKIEQAKIGISVILVFFFLPGMFFTNGGAEGGAPVWLLLGTIYISLILEGRLKAVMLLLNILVTLITWIIGYYRPELVISYSRGGNYFDTIAALVIVGVIIYMLIGLTKIMEYERKEEAVKREVEQKRMQRIIEQTATAFVSAIEKRDDLNKGNSRKVAEYAKRIAELAGKDEEYAKKAYYAAPLHDIGMIGIPDSVIRTDEEPKKQDREVMKLKPVISEEILSSITEFPYLSQGARYSHERYDGSGYPEGLKGEEIPELARIIAVADAFVTMTSRKRFRDARPRFLVREAFVKGAGEEFDPVFSDIMVKIIDSETKENISEDKPKTETEISCRDYREKVARGIPIETDIKKISFDCFSTADREGQFSAPSIVLFDSFDARTHDTEKTIERYHYLEYGEIWFDRYSIITVARNIEEKSLDEDIEIKDKVDSSRYEITAGRYDDHLKLVFKSATHLKEVIVALPNSTNEAYIGITGENCRISNISVDYTGEKVEPGDIPRIAEHISYIDHLESDLKNVQVDRWRSAATEGIEVSGRLRISFHTMSLPGANLVWHCPYIVLFHSEDGTMGGSEYQEYQVIKLNGEDEGDGKSYRNKFILKKEADFPGWEKWKEKNREGMECVVYVERKSDKIVIKTNNLGISIENSTIGISGDTKAYIALTGDQVALTDIRVDRV